jgi:hypothetical protein
MFYSVGPLGSEHLLISRHTKLTTSQKIPGLSKLGPPPLEIFKMVGRKFFCGVADVCDLGCQIIPDLQVHQAYCLMETLWGPNNWFVTFHALENGGEELVWMFATV